MDSMRIGVLGTGIVGRTIGTKLVALGHEAIMGARSPDNETARAWAKENGARSGTFAEAAAFGSMVFNCTNGMASLAALDMAGAGNLEGKVLVDLSNPLDFSQGFPPTLSVSNTDSLGEAIQRAHPGARVVKTLNTMNCGVMVDPGRVPGRHSVFVSGNDAAAKQEVSDLLRAFGWRDIIDLGDIGTARGPEMILPLWLRLMRTLGHADFNFAVMRAENADDES
jgi:8-hydroxy-5-deazaflavin:NADPH oxidoreductase